MPSAPRRADRGVARSAFLTPYVAHYCAAHDGAEGRGMDLDNNIPLPEGGKKYSHYGKTRFKPDLIRCSLSDAISRSTLICNHLLWKSRPAELREHLAEHLSLEAVAGMSDEQVLAHFIPAKRIFLERIPEDGDEDDLEAVDAEIDDDPDIEIDYKDDLYHENRTPTKGKYSKIVPGGMFT